ncbi:MAG: hypothetical protein R3C46_08030 [Hyphomonadaceae bacterium]
MRLKTLSLIAATAVLAAACGPAPGSAEWCKGVMEGSIKPSQEQAMNEGMKCVGQMMNDAMKNMQIPGQ